MLAFTTSFELEMRLQEIDNNKNPKSTTCLHPGHRQLNKSGPSPASTVHQLYLNSTSGLPLLYLSPAMPQPYLNSTSALP